MRSDFDLIVHYLPAFPEVKVYPIADLHVGAIESNVRGWENFCQRILDEENSYLLILGDMMNNAIKSSVSNIYEEVLRPREQKRYLVNALKPLRSRILACVSGNHEQRSNKEVDDDPLYDVFAKLDLEDLFRPNAAFVKLAIGTRSNGNGTEKAINTYTIALLHGAGGGLYTGTAVTRNERFATSVLEGIDILAVGHTHKGAVSKPSKIVIDRNNNSIIQRSMTVVSCCSWMSYGGYAMRKMLLPSQAQDPDQPQTLLLGGKRDKAYVKIMW